MKKYIIKTWSIISVCSLFSCDGRNTSGIETQTSDESEYAIAYNVLTDGENDNYEVFTMNPDGSNKQNSTNLPGVECTYYSFRDKLYFISFQSKQNGKYSLYAVTLKGDKQ
jgi:hypothetical protein